MYHIGVDLGGTNIAVGLVNGRFEIISSTTVPTQAGRPAEIIAKDICNAIDSVLKQAGVETQACASIGVGAPGTCDSENGVVIRSYSLAWENVPLCKMLEERCRMPIKLDNDANCAALAEVKAGAARGHQNMVLVTLGTGIGTGVVLGGKLYTGLKGSGTELGHMTLKLGGELCFCGRYGCWDAYASATALVVQAKRAAASRPESLLNRLPEITGKSIFEAADTGDVAANAVVERYCEYLAAGIANIVNALAPEMILLGGGISKQGARLTVPVEKYIRKACFDKREEAMPVIGTAKLGNEAGIIGAAAL